MLPSFMQTITYKGVAIPSNADSWELYASKDGAEAVARNLIDASKEAIDMIAGAKLSEAGEIPHKAYNHILKVCDEHAAFGAADTEPRANALDIIADAMTVIADVRLDKWDF